MTFPWIVLLVSLSFSVQAVPWKPIEVFASRLSPKDVINDHFYPLGFSSKSRFAYLRMDADEAVGCLLWNFDIINLISKQVEFRLNYRLNPHECLQNKAEVLQRYGKSISQVLRKHDIELNAMDGLYRFPIKKGEDSFTVKLKAIKTEQQDITQTKHSQLLLISKKKGVKTIGKFTQTTVDGIAVVIEHEVLGYIESPFVPRIVVVVREKTRGHKGPPHVNHVKLIGTSLKVRFTK